MRWKRICVIEDIPRLGARVLRHAGSDIALFRTADDNIFALADHCPHKGGPLSQGIVHGRHVTCPLHGWKVDLEDGSASAPDEGCARPYEVQVVSGEVYLRL